MARAKHTSKRRRRSKAVPALGAAGLLSLAGGAYAATEPAADLPLQGIASGHEITLGEEEISDVSLGTFYVFDKENASTPQLGEKLAYRGGCGALRCPRLRRQGLRRTRLRQRLRRQRLRRARLRRGRLRLLGRRLRLRLLLGVASALHLGSSAFPLR